MSEQYIVSARKYRPDSFRSIVGQQAMSQTLQRAILGHKLAHAYLFSGPRGVGKTTAARVLAKTVNCLNLSSEGEACNTCESCQAFNEQRSFNVFELDAASNNSVEDIRQLTDQVTVPPAIGKYKVYIIDEVHMLSIAAFNAFLKTLEEPPAHALFILATTEKHKVLPTILSRCQTYDFKRITVNDIADHLSYVANCEGVDAEREALEIIAEKADGGMRDALSLFDRIVSFSSGKITYQEAIDSLNVLDYSYYIKILTSLLTGDFRTLLLLVDEILGKGFDGQLIVSGMASFMRDLLVVQHPGTAHLLEKPAMVAKSYQDISSQCPSASLFKGISILSECDRTFREATNKRLHLELAFLSLISSFGGKIEGGGTNTMTRVQQTNIEPREIPNVSMGSVGYPTSNTVSAVTTATNNAQASDNTRETPARQQAPPPPLSTPTQPIVEEKSQKSNISTSSTLSRAGAGMIARFKNRQQREKKGEYNTENLGEDAFKEETLQRVWLQFISEELPNEEHVLENLMKYSLPSKVDDSNVVIPVLSETNKASITEYLPKITQYIRSKLNNKNIKIEIEVRALERSRIPMTAKERLEEMIQNTPSVKIMIDNLGLNLI